MFMFLNLLCKNAGEPGVFKTGYDAKSLKMVPGRNTLMVTILRS
jgi:hypothetical protein